MLQQSRTRVAVARAEAYLQAQQGLEVGVSHLSRVVGMSERALRRAFQSVHGTSPKRYMLAKRLGAVRHELREVTDPDATVTDVAARYGFCELGRFAGYYRNTFGETPSATLRRARG
jgi:AraC family ethanolamine operon transcriptional activator